MNFVKYVSPTIDFVRITHGDFSHHKKYHSLKLTVPNMRVGRTTQLANMYKVYHAFTCIYQVYIA